MHEQINLREALDATRTIRAMLADPDLTGDLLLVGMTIVYRRTWAEVCRALDWNAVHLRVVLRRDVPSYTPSMDPVYCQAPMIRREHCGKPVRMRCWLLDPLTGTRAPAGWCARHQGHQDVVEAQRRQLYSQWVANGSPVPAFNTGGVLARHLPAKWDEIYRWVCPGWEDRPAPVRPKLYVVRDTTPDMPLLS